MICLYRDTARSVDHHSSYSYQLPDQNYGKNPHHNQSSMGSLLTWEEEESKMNRRAQKSPKPQEPYQTPARENRPSDANRVRKLFLMIIQGPKVNATYNRQPETGSTNTERQKPKLESQIKFEKEQTAIKNIEANLLNLQMEKKKLGMEFDKIPENAKTIAQRRRKGDLEREISILDKNISSLKKKLRDMQAL